MLFETKQHLGDPFVSERLANTLPQSLSQLAK